MHIPDGFLTPRSRRRRRVVAVGRGRLRAARAPTRCSTSAACPLLGVTAAFVFAAQMLNFPVAGGTSGHFLGAALAAILLGPWLACLVMAVVLAVQAFLFADGGITALGANVLNMGVVGALGVGAADARRARACCRRAHALPRPSRASAPGSRSCSARPRRRSSSRSRAPCRSATVLPAMLGVHALIGIGEAAITVAAVARGAGHAPRPDRGRGGAPAAPSPRPRRRGGAA